jgi:23S rRNA pseudouridine955/2504/2580 synthase
MTALRIDRYLKKNHPGIPFSLMQKLLRKKAIKVNGKAANATTMVEEGDQVTLPKLETPITNNAPAKQIVQLDLKPYVIHQDAELIVLNKPQGLAVQGGTGQKKHIDGALHQFTDKDGNTPHLVHRLDKDTSGLLLLARNPKAAADYTRMFQDKDISKTYWAICVGHFQKHRGRISAPLLKTGTHEMVQVHEEGLTAITDYEVIETVTGYSLVALSPETGRTHQLRVHTAYLGCPILGDGKYGGKTAQPRLGPKRIDMCLHAREIAFTSPAGKKLRFTAPLPEPFKELLQQLGLPVHDKKK